MEDKRLAGVVFFEFQWGVRLYEGIVDNQNCPAVMVQEGNEALNVSIVIATEGTLSNREANGTLNLPRILATASSHIACKLTFQMTGLHFQQLACCPRILIFTFTIVLGVSAALVEQVNIESPYLAELVLVTSFPLSGASLLVFQVLLFLKLLTATAPLWEDTKS